MAIEAASVMRCLLMVGWGNPGMRTMEEMQHRVDYDWGNALRSSCDDIVCLSFRGMADLVVIPSVAIAGLGHVSLGQLSVQDQPPRFCRSRPQRAKADVDEGAH